MIKITKNHLTGKLVVNPDSKITGRSLYVCKNEQCIKTLLKKKRIERNFKTGMTHELNLLESVKGLEDKPRQ